MVDLLIRDANNYDRTDTRFPYLRDFDIYAGHDWASGHGALRRRQQPGVLLGGDELRQRPDPVGPGHRQHRRPRRRHLHLHHPGRGDPGVLVRRRTTRTSRPPSGTTTVGMVWGDGGAYATWFIPDAGDDPGHQHAAGHRRALLPRRRPGVRDRPTTTNWSPTTAAPPTRLAGHHLGVPGARRRRHGAGQLPGQQRPSPPRRARARRTPSTGSATSPRSAQSTPPSPRTTRWPRCSPRTARRTYVASNITAAAADGDLLRRHRR